MTDEKNKIADAKDQIKEYNDACARGEGKHYHQFEAYLLVEYEEMGSADQIIKRVMQ